MKRLFLFALLIVTTGAWGQEEDMRRITEIAERIEGNSKWLKDLFDKQILEITKKYISENEGHPSQWDVEILLQYTLEMNNLLLRQAQILFIFLRSTELISNINFIMADKKNAFPRGLEYFFSLHYDMIKTHARKLLMENDIPLP